MENKSRLSPGIQVGDYLLKELVAEGTATRTWLAEQVSVKREVLVDSLRSAILKDEFIRESFLEDVRAKAQVDHSLIGSVFEAVYFEDICFYTRESLTGETLGELLERRKLLPPSDVVHILKQVAEANLYLEKNAIGSIPIELNQIFIGENKLTRLVNMAIAEARDPEISKKDKKVIGEVFHKLLDREHPGATRVSSLCDFMVDEQREIPITWEQIKELSEQVEKQLRGEPSVALQDSPEKGSILRNTLIGLGIVAAILVGLFFVKSGMPDSISLEPRDLDQMVFVSTEVVTIEGEEKSVIPFSMDAHEVTIGEYAEFLEAVELEGLSHFSVEQMPKGITSFYPGGKEQWEAMYEAAKEGRRWDKTGRVMGVNQPVVFVEWWGAKAYANWKTEEAGDGVYNLPTEEQWLAALAEGDSESLKATEWGDVDANDLDLTKAGIYGLAGGVSEWTSSFQLHFDDKTKLPIVLGASSINQDQGALDRETVKNRRVSRSDLGFRLIRERI